MKKFMTAALACVLTLGMSVTAFAAPSVTTEKTTATDSNGNAVVVVEAEVTAAEKEEATEKAQEAYGVAPLYVRDFDVAGASESNPVTIKIPVAAINAGDTVVVLHKRSVDNVWETLSGTAGDGFVTVTVTSCSPFAVVRTATASAAELPYSPEYYENLKAEAAAMQAAGAANEAATTATATSAASPKTADEGVLGFVAIAVLCGAAYVLVPRKKMI